MTVAAYLVAIVAANLSTTMFGPSASIANAFLLIGLDLVLRDRLHDAWRGRNLPARMMLLISAGGLLSFLVNRDALPIALASTAAFAAAAVVDTIAYQALQRFPFQVRANGSNIPSALADSLIFPTIAFGAFLRPVVLGQFAAKVLGGVVWAFLIAWWRKPARLPA